MTKPFDPNSPTELRELAERILALPAGPDPHLDRLAADALGWRERRVGRLGLNGRTPGSWRWFRPLAEGGDDTNGKGRASPPRFTGPKKRAETAARLRDKADRVEAAGRA